MLLWPFNPLLGFTGSSSTRWMSWTESKVREDSKTAAHQHNERRKPFITEEHSRSWRQASRRGEKKVTEKVPYQKIYPLSQKTLLREKGWRGKDEGGNNTLFGLATGKICVWLNPWNIPFRWSAHCRPSLLNRFPDSRGFQDTVNIILKSWCITDCSVDSWVSVKCLETSWLKRRYVKMIWFELNCV